MFRAAVLRRTSCSRRSDMAHALAAEIASETRWRLQLLNALFVKLRSSATPCEGFRAVQVRPLSFATLLRSCRNRAAVGPKSSPLLEAVKAMNTRRDPFDDRNEAGGADDTRDRGDTPVVDEVCVLFCVPPARCTGAGLGRWSCMTLAFPWASQSAAARFLSCSRARAALRTAWG